MVAKPKKGADRPALRAVFFDWDGTLLNSFEADAFAYEHMFGALGMSWSLTALRQHYSPDWYRVYRAAGIPRTKWELADRLWAKYYRECRPALQPGSRWVLRTLQQQYVLALVSSGNRARVLRQLRAYGLAPVFRNKICSEDSPKRKPYPHPLQLAMQRLRVPPAACVYVGDAPEDVQMAHRAGVRVIGVLDGSPVPERLRAASPDALIQNIRDLPAFMKGF